MVETYKALGLILLGLLVLLGCTSAPKCTEENPCKSSFIGRREKW